MRPSVFLESDNFSHYHMVALGTNDNSKVSCTYVCWDFVVVPGN